MNQIVANTGELMAWVEALETRLATAHTAAALAELTSQAESHSEVFA